MHYRPHRFSRSDSSALNLRLLAGAVGLMGLALLATARGLEPDPRGYGTHEQLGFSPCAFHQWTSRVCPACGTTTAWSHALRGEVRQAAAANLGGTVLCGVTLFSAPWLIASAIAGRWLLLRPRFAPALTVATAWFALALLDWARRLYFG